MHAVMWTYNVMEGKNRQALVDTIKADAPAYVGVPDLIRMYYGISSDLKSVVEIYLWKSKSAADKFYDWEWDGATSRRWESALMTRQDFEVPMVVESEQNRLVTEA
jgi:hypothetical protein